MVVIAIGLFLAVLAAACLINVATAAVGLRLAPPFPGYHELFMVKNYLADVILWTVATVIGITMLTMAHDRLQRQRRGHPPRCEPVDPRVAVCLVAYNEEIAIRAVVEDFRRQPQVQQVVVVDNNSTDRTAAIAVDAGATVVHEPQQGYGYACIRALREGLATGLPVVVLCEADGTYRAQDLTKLLLYLEHADMVVGTRITPGLVHPSSQLDMLLSWLNQLGAKLLQLRYLCRQHLRYLGCARFSDLGCTYRAIRHDALQQIIDRLSVGGDHFSPHMLAIALRCGLTVIEAPVTFWPRVGVSKGASGSLARALRTGIAMLREIITPSQAPAHRRGGCA